MASSLVSNSFVLLWNLMTQASFSFLVAFWLPKFLPEWPFKLDFLEFLQLLLQTLLHSPNKPVPEPQAPQSQVYPSNGPTAQCKFLILFTTFLVVVRKCWTKPVEQAGLLPVNGFNKGHSPSWWGRDGARWLSHFLCSWEVVTVS